MNLLEHEAKELLKRFDLKVPEGAVYSDVGSVVSTLSNSSFPMMVKGQVPIGGRGKAGAVRKVNDAAETLQAFESILGMKIKGFSVESVLIERFIESEIEYYLAIIIDRSSGCPVLMVGRKGGMDVETSDSSDIKKLPLDAFLGIEDCVMNDVVTFLRAEGSFRLEIVETLTKLWNLFAKFDCEMVEINPLIIEKEGPVCLDAKIIINDDSLYRHQDLHLDADRGMTSFEVACRRDGLSGVELNGNIAVIANGAGLTMAVLDELEDLGLEGGAFLDLGGTDDPKRISKAMATVLDGNLLSAIEGVMICVFGGITRCDIVATGVMAALKDEMIEIPVVIRLRGVNESVGRNVLKDAGYLAYSDLIEACEALRTALRSRG